MHLKNRLQTLGGQYQSCILRGLFLFVYVFALTDQLTRPLVSIYIIELFGQSRPGVFVGLRHILGANDGMTSPKLR